MFVGNPDGSLFLNFATPMKILSYERCRKLIPAEQTIYDFHICLDTSSAKGSCLVSRILLNNVVEINVY
jgi:hypothetical protein